MTMIGSTAHAQQDPDKGRALFNEGVALFNEGKYDAACTKLEASLKALPGLGTRGKLAECYEKLGRMASAWALYKELAQLAMRAGDVTREKVANERAKALEPKLSYVTVSVGGHDVPGLVVKRQGKELERSKLNVAEPVDPGTIAFEVTAPGKRPFSNSVNVAAGQSVTVQIPALENLASAAPPPPPPPQKDDAQPTFPPPETESTPWQKPTGLVVAGVGVVVLGVGGVFGLDAKGKYDAPFEDGRCDKGTKQCDANGQSAIDDARSRATLSTIFVVSGVVLAAGGLVLYFTAPSGRRMGVSVTPATTGGAFGFRTAF